ncbi:MAG TPA: alpha/beta hydrolase domain-containing protein [Acetobacteraceae bacterium]|nr:alpha/beta hydrolase domain-containing protein [Acetobacteraceae bacterium]
MFKALLACAAAAAVLAVGLGAAPVAKARIVSVEIESSEPFAGGRDFGAGPYLRIAGKAHGELDPADPRKAVILDLDRTPRNARGMVEYATEFHLLRPADPARASGRMIHEVTNRGRKLLFSYFYDAAGVPEAALNEMRDARAVGSALPLAQGHVLLWNGWDPAAPRAPGNLLLAAPVLEGVTGTVRDEFVFGTRVVPADRPEAPLSFAAAELDPARATLAVRRTRAEPPRGVPSGAWGYAGPRAIRLLPEGTRFEAGSIYELRYSARDPQVFGVGYAATRDIAAFLRHERADAAARPGPLQGLRVEAVLAVGVSQSSRYLRHHIDLGMNADERGRRLFDGVLGHTGGAGRVFANGRFAQPGRTATAHEDHAFPENWFPLAHAATTDPISGRTDALFRDPATDPLFMKVSTSTEYWQKGSSLIHTDPGGTRDLPEPAGVRHYLVAGTRHGGRAGLTTAPGVCANANNPHSAGPLLRALLVALDAWVTRGEPPPASRVPRIADGTLLPADAALEAFPALPAMLRPRAANTIAPVTDWVAGTRGPEGAWRALVPAVDADGNERAGVRLPGIAVPLGTYTGWNLYTAEGLRSELCDREGSFAPFAEDRAAREASGDPRPSLRERYGSRARYAAEVREAADALAHDRLMLPEDAAAFAAAAAAARAAGLPD